jgi:hypothetical protein
LVGVEDLEVARVAAGALVDGRVLGDVDDLGLVG